jgi:hypothetical protein
MDFDQGKNMKAVKAGDDVYIVFQALNKSSNKEEVFLSASHNAGNNYTTINLSNGKIELRSGQNPVNKTVERSFNPQIAIDKEGEVYVAWNAKGAGNPSYVVLAISDDKFMTPVVPFVNMTDEALPGTEPLLINDQDSGNVNLFYMTNATGPADPCKTRCG